MLKEFSLLLSLLFSQDQLYTMLFWGFSCEEGMYASANPGVALIPCTGAACVLPLRIYLAGHSCCPVGPVVTPPLLSSCSVLLTGTRRKQQCYVCAGVVIALERKSKKAITVWLLPALKPSKIEASEYIADGYRSSVFPNLRLIM